MPNWTDDEGFSWFGKLQCKRCLRVFDADKEGEVPTHACTGGLLFRSTTIIGEHHVEHHVPVRVDH